MNEGRRTAKLNADRACTLCGDPRVEWHGVLVCPQDDFLPMRVRPAWPRR